MAGAGAGRGAEIMDEGGAGAEDKLFLLRNTGLYSTVYSFIENRCNVVRCILKSSSYCTVCTQSTFFN